MLTSNFSRESLKKSSDDIRSRLRSSKITNGDCFIKLSDKNSNSGQITEHFKIRLTSGPIKGSEGSISGADVTVKFDNKCPECLLHISSRLRLKQHLDQEGASSKACNICQLPMPNECSLKAHERLHSSTTALQGSYMCPECGLQFLSREMLLVHIHQDCMHGFLIASFQCMHCDRLLSSSISLEAHLLNEHTEKVYKCTQCHLVDQTIEGINEHIIHNHLENNKVIFF